MWKNGSTARMRVSAVTLPSGEICCRFATRLRWVRITPLARPVVPDEYGSTAVSALVTVWTGGSAVVASRSRRLVWPSAPSRTMIASAGRPTSAAAAEARSRKGEIVNSSFAPESASWWASSPGV